MKKFATLTIGQAPRPDLAPVFNAIAPAGTEVVHAGCLDRLTKAEVDKQFAPVGSEGLLTSRMLDGTAVVLGKSAVRKALQEKIHQLEKAGCSPIVLLCTGEFEGLTTEKVRLIEPDRLLPPVFAALLNPLQVGVMVPLIEQAQSELNKWKGLDKPPVFAAASPYTASKEELQEAARKLAHQGAEVIVLDCIDAARYLCGSSRCSRDRIEHNGCRAHSQPALTFASYSNRRILSESGGFSFLGLSTPFGH